MAALTPTRSYKLQHTSTGAPYIELKTRSQVPIFLTEMRIADAEPHQKIMSIESLNNSLISPPKPYNLDDAKWWIEQQTTGKADLPLTVLRISDPENGEMIGGVSLGPREKPSKSALKKQKVDAGVKVGKDVDLGYYLHPDWRGKGIIKPAVQALIDWGRVEEGVQTVFVRVAEDNIASRTIISSFDSFVRINGDDDFQEWPEKKGGGRKKLFIYEWTL